MRNLSSSKEGWIAADNLITLIEKSTSCPSLTSSGIQTNNPKSKSKTLTENCNTWRWCWNINIHICMCFKQKVAALETSAHHPAAVRPTQTSPTSNPEHLRTSSIMKLPSWELASYGYLYCIAIIIRHCQISTKKFIFSCPHAPQNRLHVRLTTVKKWEISIQYLLYLSIYYSIVNGSSSSHKPLCQLILCRNHVIICKKMYERASRTDLTYCIYLSFHYKWE